MTEQVENHVFAFTVSWSTEFIYTLIFAKQTLDEYM